jgi:mRNA-degrading endonuclease toxin of MazEF toxin-antitoxin module
MARGDVLLIQLPDSDQREEKGTRPAIALYRQAIFTPCYSV